ncbi:LD-carboxypeptidase [Paracrocinitomix mangrovi]|uniref:S66 peptidase family protein n=1 Tax=Paracrocinitomix mangrovi TaxID=2862509 RepID=UPI001C8CF9B5|nr:LD-carboxypeptidase [Paracrocinitomix mangrovi]UKN00610.1 LD-carboxypeptidase [Paracrocinitomix mangrovi]
MKRRNFIKHSASIALGTPLVVGSLSSFQETIKEPSIKPKALYKNDLIGITGPAGSIWNKAHIDKIVGILKNLGYRTKLGQTLYEQDGFLAGNDEMRAKELMEMFEDTNIKGILTMRGGWGCARILDMLDYEVIAKNPKVIMGFSDITSLVNAIYTKTGLVTYHGPCGYSSWDDFTTDEVIKNVVLGEPFTMKNPDDNKDDLKTWTGGKASGKLVGGNLTVISSMVGTSYEPNWNNKILFLEEIKEEPYRVDRMLWQLKQAGVYKQISGLVIGSFRKCTPEEPDKSFTLEEIFAQHFTNAPFPVYQGASFGHIQPKFTLPIGIKVEMDADNFTIKTLEKTVIS